MADFPPDPGPKEDSKFHRITFADRVLRMEAEGGMQLTRPRTTRQSIRLITTGFTDLDQAQMTILEQFYLDNVGLSFSYDLPTTGSTVQVKMEAPIDFKYNGVGPTVVWNTAAIVLREEI